MAVRFYCDVCGVLIGSTRPGREIEWRERLPAPQVGLSLRRDACCDDCLDDMGDAIAIFLSARKLKRS